MAEDSGKTLVMHQTDRFSVYLDDQLSPLNELQVVPLGRLGVISNGFVRGPNCYPVRFEAVVEGKARLGNEAFWLRVVLDNRMPVSPFPLH